MPDLYGNPDGFLTGQGTFFDMSKKKKKAPAPSEEPPDDDAAIREKFHDIEATPTMFDTGDETDDG